MTEANPNNSEQPGSSPEEPFVADFDQEAVVREWRAQRLKSQIPKPTQPSALADVSAGQRPNHEQRRIIRAAAEYACAKLDCIMPHALTPDGEVGADQLHPSSAWLAFSVYSLLGLHKDERLHGREDRVAALTKPDDPHRDPPENPDLHALPVAPDPADIAASMVREAGMPNRIALSLGFTPGHQITSAQLEDHERKQSCYYHLLFPWTMDYLRLRTQRVYTAFGRHLVVDGTYFASVAWSPESDRSLDGYTPDKEAFQRHLDFVGPERWGDSANYGPNHYSFRWDLPTRKKDAIKFVDDKRKAARKRQQKPTDRPASEEAQAEDDARYGNGGYMPTMFFGRRILLVIDAPTGLPVAAAVAPANLPEPTIFMALLIPELRRLIRGRVIRPLTLTADAGFDGPEISRELKRMGIDPRIDLMDRSNVHWDDRIQGGHVRNFLTKRGHMSQYLGVVQRTTDSRGEPLTTPVDEMLFQPLPVRRIDDQRMRVGFGCAPANPSLIATLKDINDRNQAPYAACGVYHLDHSDGSPPGPDERRCRAGVDGILYWVQATGDNWENSRVTRCRPGDGSPFLDHEVVRADIGPMLPNADWPASRGGRQISIKRALAGIYRTPVSPRDHPAFLADYKAARARIERKNGVLRQFVSVTRARVWRAIAALHAHMAVIAAFVLALTNMERAFVYGKAFGLDDETLDALVRLVAGYTVDRARVSKRVAADEALRLLQLVE